MQKFYYFDKKRHGTHNFPVEYFYVDSTHPHYHMAFHWHNEWELLRVKKGELLITLDDKQTLIKEGEIVLISGETLHGGTPSDCIYECLVFDLYGLLGKIESLKTIMQPFYNNEIMPEQFFTIKNKPVADVIDVFSDNGDSPSLVLDTLSAVSYLFAWLIKEKRYHKSLNKNRYSLRIKPVLEYIEQHFSDQLTLDSLANVAGMNARYFCKVFYAATKTTPMNYVNQYRIEHAAFLLESTSHSITQISYECGFCDSGYFTKVFKKYKDATPKSFRRIIAQS